MKIALLSSSPVIRNWFQQDYSEVKVYTEVSEEMLESELVIIVSFYYIQERCYQLQALWERYINIRAKRKALAVLGWIPFQSPNYLQITDMPDCINHWAAKTLAAKYKPALPKAIGADIRKPIRNLLLSHGDHTLHRQLILMRAPLRKVERQLRANYHLSTLLKGEDGQQLQQYVQTLKQLWQEAVPYFSLMPNYPDLKQYEEIEEKLHALIRRGTSFQPPLYIQIGAFLENTLTEITEFYELEHQKYEREYSGHR